MNWMADAACVEEDDPERWYPPSTTGKVAPTFAAEAKAVCARCPVVDACLRYAMDDEGGSARAYRYGIYGGLTGAERESLFRTTSRRARREMAAAS